MQHDIFVVLLLSAIGVTIALNQTVSVDSELDKLAKTGDPIYRPKLFLQRCVKAAGHKKPVQ